MLLQNVRVLSLLGTCLEIAWYCICGSVQRRLYVCPVSGIILHILVKKGLKYTGQSWSSLVNIVTMLHAG
jgi:hypothetical protein